MALLPRHITEVTRLKLLLALLLFMLGQIVGSFHFAEHAVEGNNDACGICNAVTHLADAALPEPIPPSLLPVPDGHIAQADSGHFYQGSVNAYSPRAPPTPV